MPNQKLALFKGIQQNLDQKNVKFTRLESNKNYPHPKLPDMQRLTKSQVEEGGINQ